jgi:CheY-like chemotaxis protein
MNRPKILIVDDDSSISGLMKAILSRVGHDVLEENRPFAALSTARDFRPELVLMDVDMPGRDGGMVAAEFAADPQLKDTPIIFVTSLVRQTEVGPRGTRQFIAKPVRPAVLVAAVEQAISERAA